MSSIAELGRRMPSAAGRLLLVFGLTLGVGGLVVATIADAATAPVGLGTAESFAVLAGTGVTNTGPTVVNGDLGSCPTPAVIGFPPGTVNGTTHANDAVACGAEAAVTTAYDDVAGRAATTTYAVPTDLGGQTLNDGVYNAPTFAITGTVTLDGKGDSAAVFLFQAGSTLITADNSKVMLINGAQACNVFWQVGSSATLGVGSTFAGTILALTSISANTSAIVEGRLLARNGATTMDSNTVTRPACAAVATTTSTVVATTTTVVATTTSTSAATTTSTSAATTSTVPATTTATSASTATTTAPGETPTPTPTAGPTTTAPPSVGVATASPSNVTPGQPTTVRGDGFRPGETLQVRIDDAQVLGTAVSDSAGSFTVTVTIPMGTSGGMHRVVVSGRGGGGGARQSIATLQVDTSRAILGATGRPLSAFGVVGLLSIGAGATLLALSMARSRRRLYIRL